MSKFDIHTTDTAPAGSVDTMNAVEGKFGFMPNLIAVMAESPATVKAYATLSGLVGESSFPPDEQQMMLLAASRVNGCGYCMAAHTGGGKRAGLDDAVIDAIRDDQPVPDERKAALHKFVTLMVEKRGWAEDAELEEFFAAGFNKAHALEVILAITMKTLSNYVNHIAETPLNEGMKGFAWTDPKAS